MPLGNVTLELVNSVQLAGQFMSWLSERRPVLAFDTETGGLDPEKEPLRLVQFGDEDAGWAIPWDGWGGVAMEALSKYTGELVGHHSKFDVRFLERYGKTRLPRERIHDTMTMCHLLDPAAPKGLKPNAARLVDSKAAYAGKILDEAMTKQGWTWRTVPLDFEPYWAYGALDTVLTAHLHKHLRPRVEAEYHNVYELERAVGWVLVDMEARGTKIDRAYTAQKAEEMTRYAAGVTNWCREAYQVSPGSNRDVAAKLESLGVNLWKRTKSGALALDEDVLLGVIGNELENVDLALLDAGQMLAFQVLSRRKSEKIRSTYLDSFLEYADEEDVVHSRINQLGTRTGRMSMERPALQTLPRGRVVRDCFIPREGKKMLSADFDAVEYRLLAHFAQDQKLFDAIGAEVDIHTAMARILYGDDTIGKKEQRRQVMKNVNFAKLYGAGVEKIALTAGTTVKQAQEFLAMYDSTFVGVKAFQKQVGNVAAQRKQNEGLAYVKTPIGRLQPSDGDRDYALVNFLIQGTAADVFKEALVRLDEAGASEWMLLPVHDEVIFELPEEDVVEGRELIMNAMQDSRWNVPLTVGVDGPLDRWGSKYS